MDAIINLKNALPRLNSVASLGKKVRLYIILVFAILLMAAPSPSLAEQPRDGEWGAVAAEVEGALDEAAGYYRGGDAGRAKRMVTAAYFDLFEESGMEQAVSLHISDRRKSELEGLFGALRSAMTAGDEVALVQAKVTGLAEALKEAAGELDGKGGSGGAAVIALFLNSLLIILREGLEAILVIAAITTYLVKSGNGNRVRTVYLGAVVAIVMSIATALLFAFLIEVSGEAREAIEGIVMLMATAVLFYVSYWLISKAEAARWNAYIKAKVDASVGRGAATALFFAALLAVYREGAETILFYQALYSGAAGVGAGAFAVTAGLVLGSLLLVGVFMLVRYGAMKVPMGPFFIVTSALMYYLAFTFAGKGVRELQEANWVDASYVEWLPTIDLMGIYPTVEGVALQSALLFALIGSLVYIKLLKKPVSEGILNEEGASGNV